MREVFFAVPGDIETKSGGYFYDRKVAEELQKRIIAIRHLSLGSSFPFPTTADMSEAESQLMQLSPDAILIVDGLAFGALDTNLVSAVKARLIALIHHPLAYEAGLAPADRSRLFELERKNLEFAEAVIVTSKYTAELLEQEYGVAKDRITIATPGVEINRLAPNPQSPPLILAVGIQVPRKGHDVLLRALALMADLSWQAVIAGAELNSEYAKQLGELVLELRLEERVKLAGFVSESELNQLYAKASIFALATRFEGYGIVFNEALSHGLPIVSCNVGAVANTVGDDAAVLVEPDDPKALANALRLVLTDQNVHQAMSQAALVRAAELGDWAATADQFVKVLDSLKPQSKNQSGK